jgi:hypothetical protein
LIAFDALNSLEDE